MTTAVANTKGMMSGINAASLKKVGLLALEATTGFVAGHQVFTRVAPKDWTTGLKGAMASLALILISAITFVKVQNEHVKNLSIGSAVYGINKLANSLFSQVPVIGTSGLAAFQLPEGAQKVLRNIFPNLGDMGEPEPIAWNMNGMDVYDHNADLGAAIEQTYETVGVGDYGSYGQLENERVTVAGYSDNVKVA
ncbi:MAG: hypothetical protein V4538_02395 [Bacteroidota bacterium]